MKVTSKKGKGDKMHVSIDGVYTFTVDETFFYSLFLNEKKDYSTDELNEILEKAGERRAYNYAVSLLSRRDHTVKEINDKLKQKGYGQYASAAVLKLSEQGYLSDERFARMYVRELINLRKYGKKRIIQELMRKGVNRDIIDDVLSEAEFPDNRLREIIERKYMRFLDTEKGVQKTVNSLLRLGYSYGEIRNALKEISDAEALCEVDYE